jgi:ribose transport system substrate-binding protein
MMMTLFKSGLTRRFVMGSMAAAFALSLPLVASSKADEPDRLRGVIEPIVAKKPLRIGVTLVHLNDDFWKGIAYGIADEAKRSNVQVVQISVAGAYGNVKEQFAQLETLKSLGVDVAVIGAAAFDGYNPALKSLKNAGIMVVAAGIPVNSANVDFGVAQDDSAIGATLAKEVCTAKGDGDATVLTIPGPAGAEWARLRHVAFLDEAKNCKGLTVVDGATGGALGIEHGLSEASDMLLKHPEAKFIYTPEVSLGMGAVQAVKQLNKPETRVVSSAVVREAIPMVKDGRLVGLVSEPGIVMGRLIVQYAIRKAEGLPTPNLDPVEGLKYPAVMVPTELITQENADHYPFELYELPPADWSIAAFQ